MKVYMYDNFVLSSLDKLKECLSAELQDLQQLHEYKYELIVDSNNKVSVKWSGKEQFDLDWIVYGVTDIPYVTIDEFEFNHNK